MCTLSLYKVCKQPVRIRQKSIKSQSKCSSDDHTPLTHTMSLGHAPSWLDASSLTIPTFSQLRTLGGLPSAISTTSMPCFRQSMKTSLVPHVAWKFPNSSFHGAPYSGVTPWRNKVLSVWTGIISAKSEIAKFSCHFLNACRMWGTKRNVSAAVLQRHGGEWRVVVSASQTTTFTCSGNAHKQHLQPDTHLISPLCCPASISAARKNLKITEAADPFHDKTTRHCTVIEGWCIDRWRYTCIHCVLGK